MKQRYVLIGGFLLMFAVSLGLILFERGQSQALARGFTPKTSAAAIRGESLTMDRNLAVYRQTANKTAAVLGALTVQIAAGQAIDRAPLGQIVDDLLSMNVPAPYRDLHFKLTALTHYLKSNNQPDSDYLREQIRLLKAEFPWL